MPNVPSELMEQKDGLHSLDVKVAASLGEWAEQVKDVFRVGAAFGDLGRHLIAVMGALPTALGNFVRSYCSATQPSTSPEAVSGDSHGDLLPIDPCVDHH